ncbi:MAG: VWA domain-containing protein [Kiritimatiellae bacterium]|nr:VWA domain-containing protein [Kiritimatiellia bacterium]
MSDNNQRASVSFKPIDALIARARKLEVAGDEESQKRVAATVARLRHSDELIDAQGRNLMRDVLPILRNRTDLPSGGELQFVRDILPSDAATKGTDVLIAFADGLERVRIEQGGEADPELDVEALGLDDIDDVVAARDRLTDEYRLLIAAIFRKLIGKPEEFTKILDLDEKSSLGDIIARAVQPPIPPAPKDDGLTPVIPPAPPSDGDLQPIIPPAPPPEDDLQPIIPPAPPEEAESAESGSAPDDVRVPSNEKVQETSAAGVVETGAVAENTPAPEAAVGGKCADVVFVIDASGSMRECFDQLRTNIRKFVEPFREEGFDSLRLGLLAYSANIDRTAKKCIYRNIVIGGEGATAMKSLYGSVPPRGELFFTSSKNGAVDTDSFMRRLDGVRCKGDEDTVFALDCAADFPYGPLESTRRVMVLFTDEKIEDGVLKQESVGEGFSQIEKVMEKIVDRHISLYVFAPASPVTDMMSEFSRVFLKNVPEFRPEATDTWANIDFARVLEMMGKQVSSSLSGGNEQDFNRAVFGQDKWTDDRWA